METMDEPDKKRRCTACTRHPRRLGCAALWVCLISGVLAVGLGLLYQPSRGEVEVIANEVLSLTPGTFLESYWLHPQEINSTAYFFNVTNPYEVQHEGAIPVLKEVGPFYYIKQPTHYNVWWSEDETLVKYDKNVTFTFNPNVTGEDPYQTNITTINLPLIAIMQLVERIEADPKYKNISKALEKVFGVADWVNEILQIEPLFVTKTADELAWGYEDPLFKIVHSIDPSLISSANFTLRHKHQTTSPNMVYTGKNDSCRHRGEFALWNGHTTIDKWGTPTARMINGTEGAMFSTFLNKSDLVYLYTDEFLRSAYFNFSEEVDVKGITGFRYTFPPDEINNRTIDPGFFPNGPNGMMNLSAIQPLNAPVFASKPHFLDADPDYLKNVTGLHPNRSIHDSYLVIEPITGLTIDAAKRIQVNARVVKYSNLEQFKNLTDLTMFPIFYSVESGTIPSDLATKLKLDLYSLMYGSEALMLLLIGITELHPQDSNKTSRSATSTALAQRILSISMFLCFIGILSSGIYHWLRDKRGTLPRHVTENSPLMLDTNS